MRHAGTGIWARVVLVFLAGGVATALVPLAVPLLGSIAPEFGVGGARLAWFVSLPSLICVIGALIVGLIVDRLGDVAVLLLGVALTIAGDVGVSMVVGANALFAARLFQGGGYACLTVAGPSFIQRTTAGDTRRAAMALWAAHTPLGFAGAVFAGAHLVSAGLPWRAAFLGHAGVTLLIGLALLALRRAASLGDARRAAGAMAVLRSARPYAAALAATATALLQTGIMVVLPGLLGQRFGLSGPQAALVVVQAMLANLCGAMAVVTTGLRRVPNLALPASASGAILFGCVVVTARGAGLTAAEIWILLFSAAIGAANSLVWSLLPAAVPRPEAAGATAGLVTQGSFLGVLLGPPIFFLIVQARPGLLVPLAVVLVSAMLAPLILIRARPSSSPSLETAARPRRGW